MATDGGERARVGGTERRGAQVACTVALLLALGAVVAGAGVTTVWFVWGSVVLLVVSGSAFVVVSRTQRLALLYLCPPLCIVSVVGWFALLNRA